MNTNLFLIGASKCGTTYLHELLSKHPDICGGKIKEPRHFQNENYIENSSWYKSLFCHCEAQRYLLDSSPCYSEVIAFPDVPNRIRLYSPKAKIIFVVREPFSRLRSVWFQGLSTGHWIIDNSYGKLMPTKYQDAVFEYPPFLDACRYWTIIQSYRKYFSDEQLKILLFDDLIGETDYVLHQLWKFLSLDPALIEMSLVDRNSGNDKLPYNNKLAWLIRHTPSWARDILPQKVKIFIRSSLALLSQNQIDHSDLTLTQKRYIKKVLAPEIEGLYSYLHIEDDPWNFFIEELPET